MKVAEIHDVYMVISGESVCEEVHPCRVIMIYSNSRVLGYGLLGCLRGTKTTLSGYPKTRKIIVSAMDGLDLVGRRERIHSGVLNGEYVDSCAPPQKSYLQS